MVTFTVPTFGRILKTHLPIDTGNSACPLKIRDQAVTFLIDFRRNVMRNLPRIFLKISNNLAIRAFLSRPRR